MVGINHTYSSLVSVFPDGRVAQFESEGKEGFEQLQFSYMDKLNETWVKDAQFVLDEVEKLGKEIRADALPDVWIWTTSACLGIHLAEQRQCRC